MRASLNKARDRYQQNYKLFIGKIESDADEVIPTTHGSNNIYFVSDNEFV
jgi:hypothetical protein